MDSDKKLSLLVYVHNDLLGDGLLKLPAIAALRPAFPDHRITWLSGCGRSIFANQLAPLIEGLVDKVEDQIDVGKHWGELLRNPLRDRYYDVIIDTQNIVRCSLILKRVPHRLFISPAMGFLLSDRKPEGKDDFTGSMGNRLLTLIRLACGRRVSPRFQLNLPQDYHDAAATLLPGGPTYIGIAPGAGDKRKCWPLERFMDLGKIQLKKGRTPVFFLGPEEAAWAPFIRAAIPEALLPEQREMPDTLRGPLLTLSLAQRIALGVANDSGAGHMLAISGVPVVSLFGHTSVEKFVDDPGRRIIINARDYGGTDITLIPLDAVADAVDSVVGMPSTA